MKGERQMIANEQAVCAKKNKDVDTNSDIPLVLTPKDIANILQVSKSQAYQLIYTKQLSSLPLAKSKRVARDEFLRFLQSR
jgi:hypothetical protein